MSRILSVLLITMLCAVLQACASAEPTKKVKAMQRKDKRLSCKEILLEMNEAEFYKKMANKARGPNLKNVLMPLGYISTYMDSEEAIEASEARIAYLDRVYEIMRCEDQEGSGFQYLQQSPAIPLPTYQNYPAQQQIGPQGVLMDPSMGNGPVAYYYMY